MLKRLEKSQNNTSSLNNARILYYDFLAGLFIYDLLDSRELLLLEQIAILKEYQDDKQKHFHIIETSLKENGTKILKREYTHLFMLPFSADSTSSPSTMLYLSSYLDGTIAGKGLYLAKTKIKKSNIRLNEISFKENEEHFGFLLLFCKKMLQNKDYSLQQEIFKECIKPMYEPLYLALSQKGEKYLYYHIAILFKEFLDFENMC